MKSIPKKHWKDMNESQQEVFAQEIFEHYRKEGFPYFPTDDTWRQNEWRKFEKWCGDTVEEDKVRQTMHGLSLAWSYMPHSWDVRCNGLMTPKEAFENDEIFMKVIRKRMRFGDNISDNGIRKMLKMFSGVQSVSNFRPSAAYGLYNKFTSPGASVLDTSCGFGGRLLGAIKADVNYTGFDPSSPTHKGLLGLAKDFGKRDIEILKAGSEENCFVNEFDFIFTSPPYFNTEVYSEESSQSCIKFTTKEEWRDGFLAPTLEGMYKSLRKGWCLVNIQDVRSYKNLVKDTIRLGQSVGFSYQGEMKYMLSAMKKGDDSYKYEPILMFKKGV